MAGKETGVGAGLGRRGAPASAKRRVPAEALTGPGADVASGARLHGYGPARCALRVARCVNYVWRKVFKVLNGFPQS